MKAQQVRAPAAKADKLNLTFRALMMLGENPLTQVVL